MTNSEIASAFEQIADLLEFQGANAFRVRAYRNAGRTLHDLSEPVERIVANHDRSLTDLSGIGADLAEKITTLVRTGTLPMLDELRGQVPESVLMLMRVPGLGPKKAAKLFRELDVKTLAELRAACETHRVQELEGFGAKTEAAILSGMTLAESPESQRMYWADADVFAQAILAHLRPCRSIKQMEMAGSYRRGRDTIGDLDVVVESTDPNEVMDRLAKFPNIEATLGRGETKMSIRLRSGLQVDLRIVPGESYGAALLYFTGSKQHNIVLRGMAKDRGMRINEYGVFRVPRGAHEEEDESENRRGLSSFVERPPSPGGRKQKGTVPLSAGGSQTVSKLEYLAGRTEEEVYATLDLPLFAPETREARFEFEWAKAGPLPKLVEVRDIQGDLHMHTTESDGKGSLEEMIAAARERGLKYIAITDHSKRVSMANGLDGKRLRKQWKQIDALNEQLTGFRVLKGVEVDILERGGLDLPDDVLAEADWVVASVHYGQNQSSAQITKRIVDALANPHVSAIAHPTGRIINRRKPYEVDLEAVFEAAKQHGKLLELNSNPARLDLDDVHCMAARRHGVPIVISTDAHSTVGLDVLRFGILQARRAGLTKADVANTQPWEKMKKMIGS
ncbi:MAG TPA: PHP domain-containing protein [Pirellulales bacterium]|jgi:DNA polymerase (family 10)|nr:PHP domain-containing protein [Pirellulales bacterium]